MIYSQMVPFFHKDKIIKHFYCLDIGKFSSKSLLFHVLNILPLKVVCSVICNYSNTQLYIHSENISETFHIIRVDLCQSFKISNQSQKSDILHLEQLSLVSMVFLYLQYIFYFVNFDFNWWKDLLELETRSKHFLPTSSATSCNKKLFLLWINLHF